MDIVDRMNYLVELWRKDKNQDAATELFSLVEPLSNYYLRRYRSKDPVKYAEQESCVNSAFIKALETYKVGSANFKTWFISILKYRLFYCFRKKQHKVVQINNFIPEKDSIFDADISYLINCLSDRDAKIVKMKYIDGLTFEEISEKTGLSKGGINFILTSCYSKMKQVIG